VLSGGRGVLPFPSLIASALPGVHWVERFIRGQAHTRDIYPRRVCDRTDNRFEAGWLVCSGCGTARSEHPALSGDRGILLVAGSSDPRVVKRGE